MKGETSTYIIHETDNAKGEWSKKDNPDIGSATMTWSQEGAYSGTKGSATYKRQTRSQSKFLDSDIEGRNFVVDTRDKKSVKEEGLLVQFLAGQQRLLERLLTPTSMSQLL